MGIQYIAGEWIGENLDDMPVSLTTELLAALKAVEWVSAAYPVRTTTAPGGWWSVTGITPIVRARPPSPRRGGGYDG